MTKRVVIVDDDVNIRTALKLRLERDALVVQTAADGKDALRQITECPPDLVILDLLLPHCDGTQVLADLKRNSATADIPVIILTACPQDSEALLSASEIIARPFSPKYLAQRVHALLAGEASPDEA